MKALSSTLLLAGFLSFAGYSATQAAPAPTPYLETIPATFLWQFNATGVGTTRVVQPIDSSKLIEDPEILNPVNRITTETGIPITYTKGNGNQAFFVQQLLRKVIEGFAVTSQVYLAQAAEKQALAAIALDEAAVAQTNADAATVAGNTEAADAYNDLAVSLREDAATYTAEADDLIASAQPSEDKIKLLKRQLNDKWELTLVRAPQTSANGVLTSPYWVFLTKIDSTQYRTLAGYDTGLRIVPKYTAGTKTETLSDGNLVGATGSITTYFTLEFESLYASDPLHLVGFASRGAAIENEDYNKTGSIWQVFGSGYMTYSLRSTAGSPVAVLPTKIKVSGYGSWFHTLFDNPKNEFSTFSGTAPLNIRLGEVKYQRSEYFPEFTP